MRSARLSEQQQQQSVTNILNDEQNVDNKNNC